MSSIPDLFADLDAAVAALEAVDWDGFAAWDRMEALSRLETARRLVAVRSGDVIASVDRCDQSELGGIAFSLIADVLRITPREARRRLADARQLQARTTLTGEAVEPELPGTAAAWNAGLLDVEHLRVIQKFIRDLPFDIPAGAVTKAEAFLADKAAELRPDQLAKLAERVALELNPDGTFNDEYRARQRGFTWCGGQRPDGMSVGRLIASPELRATIEALLAKYAAPGRCNPADQSPTVNEEPGREVADRDARSMAQRQHDGLLALLRSQLGDPKLGRHNGLPVTVIVTATLEQICSATGQATTAGGTRLPMSDLIRMATHAWHYLAVFEKHLECPLYLGRTRRIATPEQRIMLHAMDRGCTKPGCTMPGYLCEVHHVDSWATGGLTNIDLLAFACKPDHGLITDGGWKTRKLANGRTEWIPPPQIPLPGGTNDFHHPERLTDGDWGLASDD